MTIVLPTDVQGVVIDELRYMWFGRVDTVLPADDTTLLDDTTIVVQARNGRVNNFGLSGTVTVDFDVYVPCDIMEQRASLEQAGRVFAHVTRLERMGVYPFIAVDWDATTTPYVVGVEHGAWRINFEVTYLVANHIDGRV